MSASPILPREPLIDSVQMPQVFDRWAQVYDVELNPLLSLEQRFLERMLPDVRSLHVLDAGCGTGRWLNLLAKHEPHSLIGIDLSTEMLHRAAAKSIPNVDLRLGSCVAMPIQDSAAQLVLLSFLLSHVEDIDSVVKELHRVTTSKTDIFITDMHPETAAVHRWKRSFREDGNEIELQTYSRTLNDIVERFQQYGFEVSALIEPAFGKPELELFNQSGREKAYQAVVKHPAIYILHISKPARSSFQPVSASQKNDAILLTGTNCILGPQVSASASLVVNNGTIQAISSRSDLLHNQFVSTENTIDLTGYLLFPGLINAHDHLEFGFFSNLGQAPYENAAQWAEDIHNTNAEIIACYKSIPKNTSLWWGALRNLLCGATTVCHHNPLVHDFLEENFPVRVVSHFNWAHSLHFEPQLADKFYSSGDQLPFILHAAEGIDIASSQEVSQLDKMHALSTHTVLVHGLALTEEDIKLINQRGTSLVVCPSSNYFLFHKTHSRPLLEQVHHLVLGSDSPLTAAGDLLDEMRYTHTVIGIDVDTLYEMVTTRPASVLRLHRGEGALKPGAVADVIALRNTDTPPAQALANATFRDIELVLLAGRIQLASPAIYERLSAKQQQGLQAINIDGHTRWLRAPIDHLFSEAEAVLGSDAIYLGGKKVRRAGH
jgi:cytosine/adenosine deaminase-related metal-dependent hydrolase/ubiquinone/menaquinone biosynthesis C-methylase UbiE